MATNRRPNACSQSMFSIAVICTANRCRSIMAHAIMIDEARKRSLPIEIYSAGVADFSDEPPLAETSRTCLYYDTPVPKQKPTWVAELPLDSIDRFLVMEQRHAEALQNQFGVAADRISLLGTFDPKDRGAPLSGYAFIRCFHWPSSVVQIDVAASWRMRL